jgi:hypothetical protein
MRRLDRPGIFKARLLNWAVRTAESGAVAITAEYLILSQLDGSEWIDWSGAEEHSVFGDTYVVKKDGTVHTSGVEQLVAALGWNGDLRSVVGRPPDVVVQVTVKDEEYQGKKRLKVAWVNPGDYTPRPETASDSDVAKLQVRFGSLLRAAASVATKKAPAKAPAATQATPASAPAGTPPVGADYDPIGDDIPF